MQDELATTVLSGPFTSFGRYYSPIEDYVRTGQYQQPIDDPLLYFGSSLAASKAATVLQVMIMPARYREAIGAVPDPVPYLWNDVRKDNEKERFERFLYAAFDSEPLEDGMDHPAEEVIADALETIDKLRLLPWLREFSLDHEQPVFAASVLRCLGRISELGTEEWRVGLVRTALTMKNVQIRDAAVQAAEHWADHGLIEVLQDHNDTEPWIADYVDMVISDITPS